MNKNSIVKRREEWDEAHPEFSGAETARNLREKLHTYIHVVKHEEENEFVTMDMIVQRMATYDKVVREVLDEIQRRYEEEVEAQRHELSPAELWDGKVKDAMKELVDLDLATQLKGSSAFTPDTDAEGKGPSDDPLLNRVDKELKRKSGVLPSPRIAKVGGHSLPETVYNPEELNGTLQAEMERAINILIPATNEIIAAKIRDEYNEFIARKLRQAEMEMEE